MQLARCVVDLVADDDYDEDGPRYEPASSIEAGSLRRALCGLSLLGDDPFLSGQAFNLAIVDEWLTQIEEELLRKLWREDRTPTPEAVFVSAQSQMWIFAAYELLRTWRQRAKDFRKLASNGGLSTTRLRLAGPVWAQSTVETSRRRSVRSRAWASLVTTTWLHSIHSCEARQRKRWLKLRRCSIRRHRGGRKAARCSRRSPHIWFAR